ALKGLGAARLDQARRQGEPRLLRSRCGARGADPRPRRQARLRRGAGAGAAQPDRSDPWAARRVENHARCARGLARRGARHGEDAHHQAQAEVPRMTRTALVVAAFIAAAGLLTFASVRFGLGRLPGDIVIDSGFVLYLPITTSILVSLLL